jgi:hypothetical protein
LIFDTEIVPDRAIIYRGSLELAAGAAPKSPEATGAQAPQPPPAPQTQAPRAPTKMYLIPGCYLGNVAPDAAMLRPGCDIKKVIVSP